MQPGVSPGKCELLIGWKCGEGRNENKPNRMFTLKKKKNIFPQKMVPGRPLWRRINEERYKSKKIKAQCRKNMKVSDISIYYYGAKLQQTKKHYKQMISSPKDCCITANRSRWLLLLETTVLQKQRNDRLSFLLNWRTGYRHMEKWKMESVLPSVFLLLKFDDKSIFFYIPKGFGNPKNSLLLLSISVFLL